VVWRGEDGYKMAGRGLTKQELYKKAHEIKGTRRTRFIPTLFHNFFVLKSLVYVLRGTAVAQWLRCCATNQKVAGSIPAGVIGIFH